MKNNAESLEKLREKERLKYRKKKENGQVKFVIAMNARERRQKRKQWKKIVKYIETIKLQHAKLYKELLMNASTKSITSFVAK